ncbi:MAG: ABC transporter ATP-binding protein [Lachnospiraceae bacterium]|nr:ABC transporter ATP-binding protein [Lachnospiraceae bacterium]
MSHLSLDLEKRIRNSKYSDIKLMSDGVLRNILYTDVINVFLVIGHHIPSIVCSTLMISVLLIYLSIQDIWAALIIIVATLIGILLSIKSKKYIAKASKETNMMMKAFDTNCSEFISLTPMIQTNDLLSYYQKKTKTAIENFISASRNADIPIELWSGLVSGYHSIFTILLSAFLVLPFAGRNPVDMLFFTMIANMTLSESQKVSQLIMQVIRSNPSYNNVESIRSLKSANGNAIITDIENIKCDKVSFAYPNSEQCVLNEISLSLNKGDTICVKGLNGAGKTTFYKLLTGLYNPTEFQIKLNEIDLPEISRESLNQQILYISQDEKCLNEPLNEYLREISGKSISENTIKDWCNLINYDKGNESITGNGDSLSGGQRKKLYLLKLLSRAESASVIIADELAAGMDAETVPIMQSIIQKYASQKDKIIFITDHQNYSGITCNVIMTFNNGNITVQRQNQ